MFLFKAASFLATAAAAIFFLTSKVAAQASGACDESTEHLCRYRLGFRHHTEPLRVLVKNEYDSYDIQVADAPATSGDETVIDVVMCFPVTTTSCAQKWPDTIEIAADGPYFTSLGYLRVKNSRSAQQYVENQFGDVDCSCGLNLDASGNWDDVIIPSTSDYATKFIFAPAQEVQVECLTMKTA